MHSVLNCVDMKYFSHTLPHTIIFYLEFRRILRKDITASFLGLVSHYQLRER